MELDNKAVMLFRVFVAHQNFDAVPKTVSKTRALYFQDASYYQHPLKFQRYDRILVPLENLTYECPVGINERTGEVGNLCLDRVTPVEGKPQPFRIHGVFTEYGSSKPVQLNRSSLKSNDYEFPPSNLYPPRWQYHYGDPFLLRPEFLSTSSDRQDTGEVKKIDVFNLRTGDPLSVPLSKVRLHPNYRFKSSRIRISKSGLDIGNTPFHNGQLLTVAILGGRNVRLGGQASSSLLFCLSTGSGIPSWVFESQLEPLDKDFMSFANHTYNWLISDMEGEVQGDLQGPGPRDFQVMFADFQNSSADSRSNWTDFQRQRYEEVESDLEDAFGEDYSEDGDIQSRGMFSPTQYYGGSDRERSRRRSRGGMPPVQTSRQSSVGVGQPLELVRVSLIPKSEDNLVRVTATPVETDDTNRRGRNPVPRLPGNAHPPEGHPTSTRTRTSRWTNLAPTPDHFDFLGDRLREEGERLYGMDMTRYHSQEREHHEDELDPGQSTPPARAYKRSRSRGYGQTDMEHLNSPYQRTHPRRSPPVGDGR